MSCARLFELLELAEKELDAIADPDDKFEELLAAESRLHAKLGAFAARGSATSTPPGAWFEKRGGDLLSKNLQRSRMR